jgi:hypothetical protein
MARRAFAAAQRALQLPQRALARRNRRHAADLPEASLCPIAELR